MATQTLINGLESDQLPSADRGLQYGDGLFETIRCVGGRPRWLERHLARLRLGCERLQLQFDAFDAAAAEIGALASGETHCIVKLILTRGVSHRRGYRPNGDESPSRIVTRHDWPAAAATATPAAAAVGFRVAISKVRLGMNPLLAGIKHLNRLEQVMAQSAMRQAPLEEVLMLSSAGQVIGGSMSNVFFCDHTGLFTPSLRDCGVEGIMRGLVCEAAAHAGLPVRIRDIEPAELKHVDEAFVTNVRWGVQSITLLEGRPLSSRAHARALWNSIDATHA